MPRINYPQPRIFWVAYAVNVNNIQATIGVMAWCDVSLELQSWVLRNLRRDDLRQCRLVDKTTSVLSTPILFSTLHISPSMNSFRRLSKIAERPELAGHVQRLECHNCGLA